MNLDQETDKVLSEGEKVMNFVNSDGWRWAKDRILDLVADVQNIGNIDASVSSDVLLREVQAKQLAVDMVKRWLEEVEGRANQHKSQDQGLANSKEEEEIIKQYGE